MGRSLFDKVWDAHVVEELPGGNALLFIDRIIAIEITTPQPASEIAERFGDRLFDPDRIMAINDHVSPAKDTESAIQAHALRTWAKRHGVKFYDVGDNGICHVVAPERGYVEPGITLVCGDSHTCTHGAFGAFALGVGSTAQGGAMLSGAIIMEKPKVLRVNVTGRLRPEATAKDLTLTVIATLGFKGATGCVIEYHGSAIEALSMEERMTLCNMAIEAGATTGMCAPDETTIDYLRGREVQPKGEAFERKAALWRKLDADPDATYERIVEIDASQIRTVVSWGTNPSETVDIDGVVPADGEARSLEYMGLEPGTRMRSIALDQAFLGSCTNARITDLRAAAAILRGRKVTIPTIITPGSQAVKRQAEREGLHDIFQDAGALWTHSSCGPCLGMSMGIVAPGTRVISSTNRNFPGRMGAGGRVHLATPVVVAASAVLGRIASPSDLPPVVEPQTVAAGAGMIVSGTVLAIPQPNVDTDQVFPGKYLTLISREGFGNMLFEGMAGGREILASHPGTTILVTGENFGCGSSREHAVWALTDYGFKAIVAPSLARIFHENAYNNGLVPVIVEDVKEHEACLRADALEIDLEHEVVRANGEQIARFALDPLKKEFLLRGGFMEYLSTKVDTVREWSRRREASGTA